MEEGISPDNIYPIGNIAFMVVAPGIFIYTVYYEG